MSALGGAESGCGASALGSAEDGGGASVHVGAGDGGGAPTLGGACPGGLMAPMSTCKRASFSPSARAESRTFVIRSLGPHACLKHSLRVSSTKQNGLRSHTARDSGL